MLTSSTEPILLNGVDIDRQSVHADHGGEGHRMMISAYSTRP
jgi:hypothetical protein